MSFNYTKNMLHGIGTSRHVQQLHYVTALRLNAAIMEHADVMRDATRSRGEKSPMLARLSQKLEQEAAREVLAMRSNINARITDAQAREKSIKDSMPLEKALNLSRSLVGLDAAKVISICKKNKELALALAVAPGELTGFSQEQALATLIAEHYPDLKQANDEIDGDVRAYESLERNVANTVQKLRSDVDWSAIKSRYDESRLDVTPPPVTMAEQNAELARLEKASGIEPTV